MKLSFRLALFLSLLLIISCSDLHITDNQDKLSVHQLPMQLDDEIHKLLRQEMQAIQTGMMSLIPAIASGDWREVSAIAKNIEASYILKQALSPEQRHALHKSLPAGFIKQDQAFHHSAGMLAHAAEKGHADIVSFYFYKLNAACVECHKEYANDRFPDLAPKESNMHYH